jgi:hypothetical protein
MDYQDVKLRENFHPKKIINKIPGDVNNAWSRAREL